MKLTLLELKAVGQAIGFVMAGDTDEWGDEKTVAALESAWTKITKAMRDREAKAETPGQEPG